MVHTAHHPYVPGMSERRRTTRTCTSLRAICGVCTVGYPIVHPFLPGRAEEFCATLPTNCHTFENLRSRRASHPCLSPKLSLVASHRAHRRLLTSDPEYGTVPVVPGAGSLSPGERLLVHPTTMGGMVGYPPCTPLLSPASLLDLSFCSLFRSLSASFD